jgi:hypothetical protein
MEEQLWVQPLTLTTIQTPLFINGSAYRMKHATHKTKIYEAEKNK